MKHNFYFYTFVILLVALNFLLMYKITNLEYKLNTLNEANVRLSENKELSENQIQFRSFKEQSYINQQERDTTLILLIFTILAGFVVFITHRGFLIEVKRNSANMEKLHADHIAQYNEQQSIILELKSRIDLDAYFNAKSTAREFLSEGMLDWYLSSMLEALKFHVQYYIWFTNLNPDTKQLLISDQIRELRRVYTAISDKDLSDVSEFELITYTKEIAKYDNPEIDKYLSLITAKVYQNKEAKK